MNDGDKIPKKVERLARALSLVERHPDDSSCVDRELSIVMCDDHHIKKAFRVIAALESLKEMERGMPLSGSLGNLRLRGEAYAAGRYRSTHTNAAGRHADGMEAAFPGRTKNNEAEK